MENKEKMQIDRWTLWQMQGIEWLKEYGKILLITVSSLLALLFLTFNLIGRFRGDPQEDFIKAQASFEKWYSASSQDPTLFQQLSQPLKSHGELEGKFGAAIAQRLLEFKEAALANGHAMAALKRLQEGTPYHAQFASTTLLIEQGKLQQALEETKKLKDLLDKDTALWTKKVPRAGSLLYAFTLFRMASLEREEGSSQGELLAWQELEKFSQSKDPESYKALELAFSQGDASLKNYIAFRKATLKKS